MLIEFSVENFRSIKERVTLSMVAGSKKENLEENLIPTDFKDLTLLKSAVIYGPNASGKSNLIRAMWTMRQIVMKSAQIQKGEKLPLTPFKLDSAYSKKSSSFEVVFIQNGIRYVYGFSADSKKIYDEYLYYYPKGRKATIFERRDTTDFYFSTDKKEQYELSNRTLENALYLSVATQWNYKKTSMAFDWIRNLKFITPSSRIYAFTAKLTEEESEAKEYIKNFLHRADTGIQDFSVEIEELTPDKFPSDVPDSIKDIFSGGKSIKIMSTHYVDGDVNRPVLFNFSEESDGTKKLFEILGPWYDVLKNGRILFVDELSVRLHPHLVEFLVDIFNNPNFNRKNAQLIFTTHNTYLLKLSLFRKDQIWFTEKTSEQSTDLYSLHDIKGVRDENIEKGYLLGRYGAIPFIDGGY